MVPPDPKKFKNKDFNKIRKAIKLRGSNWYSGPHYPKSGWGKVAFRPLSKYSRFGKVGAVGWAITAYQGGGWIGRKLDKKFKVSDKASTWLADRNPRCVERFIHKHGTPREARGLIRKVLKYKWF